MAYLMSKIITSYLLWGWFIRSSLQHRVSWVGIRWIIDFFFFCFQSPTSALGGTILSVYSSCHDISTPVSSFHVHVSNRFSTMFDTRWFRSSVFPFLLQTSPSFWYKLFFCPNMISDVCTTYWSHDIINKSQEDCKSINLQRNNFLSTCDRHIKCVFYILMRNYI